METIVIDGADITTREALHSRLALCLGLRDYYGRNLDALYDCLTERQTDTRLEVRGRRNPGGGGHEPAPGGAGADGNRPLGGELLPRRGESPPGGGIFQGIGGLRAAVFGGQRLAISGILWYSRAILGGRCVL